MENTALLVIDMVNDFVSQDGKLYIGPTAQDVIAETKDTVDWARENNIPLIYVCDRHLPDDLEFEMFPSHCLVGSFGADIVGELQPATGETIISKHRFSAFFQTPLEMVLNELDIDHLVLVGVCTQICVLYTAADARMRGYRVTVPRKAVGSFDQDAHANALHEMETTLGVQLV